MTEDRRHPHRLFDPALIEEYLGGRKINSVELLPQGKSNSNYKVALEGDAWVLRLHSGGAAERERTALRLVEDIVPVPTLLAAGDDWSLFSFIEGEHLAGHPECLRAAARAVAGIWTITFPERGWIGADGTVTPFDFGGERDFGTAMLEDADVNEWLGPQAVQALARIFRIQAERPADTRPGGCLVHGDFNPSNVIVRDGEVVAVLDWEFSHSGEPFMDISNLVRHTPKEFHEDIRRGVESSGMTLPPDWLQRCEFAHVGSYLEFLTTRRSDEFKQDCAGKIRAFIEKYSKGC